LRRVAEFGNGWFPRWQRGFDPDRAVARLRQAAAAAGRDPTTFSITVFNAPADEAVLASYRKAGIHRVLLEVPDRGRDVRGNAFSISPTACGLMPINMLNRCLRSSPVYTDTRPES
jgi:alkanesulfonate monooxygenase SsuD/methylene tetrahydromethanopterin reductase-like flavin-dependent oxidoreductase (luciferase family)